MIKITAVSYLNTLPFIYGILHSGFLDSNEFVLNRQMPALCSEAFNRKEADIVLVPSGNFSFFPQEHIITSFCIGAYKKVKSVLLVSQKPVSQLKTILLDYQSTTSIKLIKILATYYWKQPFTYIQTIDNYENSIQGDTGGIIIGDRALSLANNYAYTYDLAEIWWKLTQLPFVFAFWAKTHTISDDFLARFDKALEWGVNHRFDSLSLLSTHPTTEHVTYLEQCISFVFNTAFKNGL